VVDHFDDLFYRHEGPSPAGHPTAKQLTALGRRWLPPGLRETLCEDWQRLSPGSDDDAGVPGLQGVGATDGPGPLDADTTEAVFGIAAAAGAIADWAADHRVRRVAVADRCPWTHIAVAGADAAGVEVAAVIETAATGDVGPYRDLSVVGFEAAEGLALEGVIVATRAPARVAAVTAACREAFAGPVLAVTPTRCMVRADDAPPTFAMGSADDTALAALPAA